MLTPLQRASFALHSILFSYLPSQVLKWDAAGKYILHTRSRKRDVFGNIFRLHLLLQSIHFGAKLFSTLATASFRSLDFSQIFVTATCFYSFLVCVIVEWSMLREKGGVLKQFNSLFQLNSILCRADFIRMKASNDVYGFCSLIAILTALHFPFSYTFAVVFMDYDPTMLLVDKILPDPTTRRIPLIMLSLIFRICVQFLAALEFARSGSYTACILLACLNQTTQIITCLWNISFYKFANLYVCMSIIFSKIRQWFNCFVFTVHSSMFWGTVISCWFVCRCWEKVDFFVYFGAFIVLMILIIVQVLLLPDWVLNLVLIQEVVFWHRRRMRFYHNRLKLRSTLRSLKVSIGISPILVWYGPFFVINRHFLTAHIMLTMLRILDLVVIFKPN